MKLVYFTHSLASCWNHGNAHFLRGVLRELQHAGHGVLAFEPAGSWSLQNLLRDHGEAGLDAYRSAYPELSSREFDDLGDTEAALDGADAVIVHEWNEPELVASLGRMRRLSRRRFTLFFHDTHHRAVSDPEAIRRFDLEGYDGVLAFGEALAQVYRSWGWGDRVWVWHEAADTSLFRPPAREGPRDGLVWIGNWGDDERSAELETFLLRPATTVGLPLDIHGVRYPDHALRTLDAYGVRYPDHALRTLDAYGVRYRGWLPNPRAPEVFARHLATVHVPRRFYVDLLPGIPTIRVFEALACGIPLLSAPWRDAEGLFRPDEDYLVARDEAEMTGHMAAVCNDPGLRRALVANGLEAIRARHSCAHRAEELLGILRRLGAGADTKETIAG